MLEKLDLTKKMGKEEYKEKMEHLEKSLGKLQRRCKELNIPVMIAFEGFGAAGKGLQIGKLIQALDPRGFRVYAVKSETEEEKLHPFLWRFWTKLPEKGRIAIYDTSWYTRVLKDRFDKKVKKPELADAYESILSFEDQLTEDGMVIIKLFLAIDKKEQKKRFDRLLASRDTAWRVTKGDLRRNEKFDKYQEMNEEMLARTDTEKAPWHIVEAVDRRFATVKIYSIVEEMLARQIEKVEGSLADDRAGRDEGPGTDAAETKDLMESILGKVDLSLSCGREEAARRYAAEKRCIMVLKGANTVAAFPDGTTYVNHSGNPGLARGGSGDALTGIMGAMLCQFPPEKAVPLAVYLHGLAGDLAAGERGEYGMTITDVIEALPRAMKLITEE